MHQLLKYVYLHLNLTIAHRGKSVFLLKDTSKRKRRLSEFEELKEEEKSLSKNK